MHIAIGQQWKAYTGSTIQIIEYREPYWVGLDLSTGNSFQYGETGCCYTEGYSGFDLETLHKDVPPEAGPITLVGDEPDDADALASETLQALGWTFDGKCWTAADPKDDVVNHPLYAVFMDAIVQAMYGKGKRHGGNVTPFLDQPWVHYTKMHGRGFATGQAAKKLEEAASTRSGDAFETEMLGAMVYAGMAVLKERGVV